MLSDVVINKMRLRRRVVLISIVGLLAVGAWMIRDASKRMRDQAELDDAARQCSIPAEDIYWYGHSTKYSRMFRFTGTPYPHDKLIRVENCLFNWGIKHNALFNYKL